MARRELKIIPVMTRIEPMLDQMLRDVLNDDDDTASTFIRGLLIREFERRGKLTPESAHALMGAAR